MFPTEVLGELLKWGDELVEGMFRSGRRALSASEKRKLSDMFLLLFQDVQDGFMHSLEGMGEACWVSGILERAPEQEKMESSIDKVFVLGFFSCEKIYTSSTMGLSSIVLC